MYTIQKNNHNEKPEKEAIHSGHFMVSHFEAEAQDDEDELAVPVPEEVIEIKNELEIEPIKPATMAICEIQRIQSYHQQQLGIDTSLSKLFQCMSLAYRQKLTSPKWNRFRGIRLRWKDKIRLNNVIWRCWHMQFIKKENTYICQFASPLDVDTHNKPEAVVLEGKYWKRKLAAVTAEYKKWRMFYRNQALGHTRDTTDMLTEMELLAWNSQNPDDTMHMMVDEDYMGLMSDTLFSTISNQPFAFPDTREIAKAGLADFIQPSLGPLQPNLDDYMDTFEPFHDLMNGKLAPVPEENVADHIYKTVNWCYSELDLMTGASVSSPNNIQTIASNNSIVDVSYPHISTGQLNTPIKQNNMQQGTTNTQHLDTYGVLMPYNTARGPMYSPNIASKNIAPIPSKSITDLVPMKNNQMYNKATYNTFRQDATITQQQQQQQQRVEDMNIYKLSEVKSTNNVLSHGYKFPLPPAAASNVKFTPNNYKQLTENNNLKVEKSPPARKNAGVRGRQRSRSNTREHKRPPPLISAISDPSLIHSGNSALLTQLLLNTESVNVFGPNHRMGGSSHELHSSAIRVKEEHTPVPILPQPSPVPAAATATTLIITTPVNLAQIQQTSMNEPLLLNTVRTSSSPALDSNSSSLCLNSPTSSQGSLGSPTRDRRSPNRDQNRRVGHIHAEQKRRYNIKNGFDMIHSLIPHLNQNPNAKLSKAAMLQKGAEYIKQLRTERNLLKEEMDTLKQQIDSLNTSISNCQSLLPATGAPVSRRRDNKIQEMFDEYVRTRTLEDWKFWIFSLLFQPLLASFNNFVSTASMEDLYRTTLLWVEQHCTLGDLRPVVLNSLRYLCTKTDILSEPEKLPEEARQVVLANDSTNS